MTTTDFIPVGRTSRIQKDSAELQIQSEYACRPNPRLTTSVTCDGQVVHKVQQDLTSPISTLEEKTKVEKLLRKQHLEVIEIVNGEDFSLNLTFKIKPMIETKSLSLIDKLATIGGVEKVYRIDNDGHFDSSNVSDTFKKQFSAVFKSLFEVLDVFSQIPGGMREKGVLEIEPGRLYLVSGGHECYFLLTRRTVEDSDFESSVLKVLEK